MSQPYSGDLHIPNAKHMAWGGGVTVMRLQPLTGGIMLPKQDQSGSVSEIFWLELEKDPVPGAMGQKRVEVEEEGGLILSHTEKACLL